MRYDSDELRKVMRLTYDHRVLIWVFPSMYIAQKLRLAKYLGANVVAWGVVMMLLAVPNSFGPFFFLRILLGMYILSYVQFSS